ncbi:MAG: DsbA family oxidoreductase [Pseudomonadota bacterium]|nr:DsbA family oxidoreductase [Pseudomonadota bacterium]
MIIDIYADTTCPWCLIGKRQLERALRETGREDAIIRWRAFQIYPHMPDRGGSRTEWLAYRYPEPVMLRDTMQRLHSLAARENVELDWAKLDHLPNTKDSHRLIRLAADFDCQETIVDSVFEAYFLQQRDIGDRDVLLDIAKSGGLNTDMVATHLDSNDGVAEIKSDDQYVRRQGIGAVPLFVFEGEMAFTGAQDMRVFRAVFDKVDKLIAKRKT